MSPRLDQIVKNATKAHGSLKIALDVMATLRCDASPAVAKTGEDTQAMSAAYAALTAVMCEIDACRLAGAEPDLAAIEVHTQEAAQTLWAVVADDALSRADDTFTSHAFCRVALDALVAAPAPVVGAAQPAKASAKARGGRGGRRISAAKCNALAASFANVWGYVAATHGAAPRREAAMQAIEAAGLDEWGELNYSAIGPQQAFALLTLHAMNSASATH